MQSDRSLRYFLAGVALLVLATVGIYAWRQRGLTYRMEDTPEAVVFNYLLAVQRQDAPMLAALLVQNETTPTLDEIRTALASGAVSLENYSVRLGKITVEGDRAWVEVELWTTGDSPNNSYGYWDMAVLQRQDGRWKIVGMPGPLWSWQWERPDEVLP